MRRVWVILITLLLVMSGCAAQELGETTAPQQTAVQDTEEPETAPPTEQTVPPTQPPEPTEPEIVAERITEGVQVFSNSRNLTGKLGDDNHYTSVEIHKNQLLRLVSETPVGSLYVEWNRIPGSYTLFWEGGSMQCGEEGFLHDYIRLPEEVRELTFAFEDETPKVICDLLAYTSGSAPEGVQDWDPPCEQADILVFPTHSDDDVLFFGPLIAHYAVERELAVQTAFMVDHSYARERQHERLNGLWEMGVRNYPILWDAPDTGRHEFDFGMRYYAASDVPRWQVEQIRRFQPLVVVGHDLEGEYGNAGHKVNAYYLTQTVELAADAAQYPESAEKYGAWETPKLYLHLYPENAWIFEVNAPLENDPQGRTPFEIAEDAMLWHVSQHSLGLRVRQGEVPDYDCRPFGLYRSLVGFDTTADVMENIDSAVWRGEEP